MHFFDTAGFFFLRDLLFVTSFHSIQTTASKNLLAFQPGNLKIPSLKSFTDFPSCIVLSLKISSKTS